MARSIKTNYGKKFKDKAGNSVFVFCLSILKDIFDSRSRDLNIGTVICSLRELGVFKNTKSLEESFKKIFFSKSFLQAPIPKDKETVQMTATSQDFVKLVKNIFQKKEKLKLSHKYNPVGFVVIFVVSPSEKFRKGA